MGDRERHLQSAKQRALQYLDSGRPMMAVTSLLADLAKREDTKVSPGSLLAQAGLGAVEQGPVAVREFIEGFS